MRDLIEKGTKRKKYSVKVQNALAALDGMRDHAGLDGALFGRMATGIALSRVDSAVHVGHALTTHAIQSSVDFFSAQDNCSTVRPAKPVVPTSVRASLRQGYSICRLSSTSDNYEGIVQAGAT